MADKRALVDALRQLDGENDDHWTSDGLPKIEAVSKIFGSTVTRDEITATLPRLNRAARLERVKQRPNLGTMTPEQMAERKQELAKRNQTLMKAREAAEVELRMNHREAGDIDRFEQRIKQREGTTEKERQDSLKRYQEHALKERQQRIKAQEALLDLASGSSNQVTVPPSKIGEKPKVDEKTESKS